MSTSLPLPRVGILVITHAAEHWQRDLQRCLSSLEHVTYPKDRLELICAESFSPLGPAKPWFDQHWMPKSGQTLPRISYIFQDTVVGFAGNNNVMFQKACELDCEYVYILNKDTEVDPNFITYAVERAEQDQKIAYVQSLMMLGEDHDRVNSTGNALHYLGFGYCRGYRWTRAQADRFFMEERQRNPELEIAYWSGAAVLGRVSLIKQWGLFDEGFFLYHEDTDAALQARIRGYKNVIEPRSIIYHYYEFSKSIKKFYWIERNRLALMISYYKVWTWCLIAIPFICVEIMSMLFALKSGWWREKLRSWGDYAKPEMWRWLLARRKVIQAARIINDHEFLRLAETRILFQQNVEGTVGDSIQADAGGWIMAYIANPVLTMIWKLIYPLVR